MSLSREDLGSALADLDHILAQIDTTLSPILSKPLEEVTKDMAPLDNAKLQVTLAYTMNTLYFLYMRLQNANLVGHDILNDMERLKAYLAKVKEAESSETQKAALKLDKGAARRFITNALWEAKDPVAPQSSPKIDE